MDDSFTGKRDETIDYLLQYSNSLLLTQLIVLDVFVQIAITKFLNDVVVIRALHDIIHLYDIFMFQ